MNYSINDAGRKLMHEQLDRIINQINEEGLDPTFVLPNLQIQLTRVNKDETEESIVRVGIEFADMVDGTLTVEEEYFVHDIYILDQDPVVTPTHPYHFVREWNNTKEM